jgi:hypothetical protein
VQNVISKIKVPVRNQKRKPIRIGLKVAFHVQEARQES